jgi:hypothetical protein
MLVDQALAQLGSKGQPVRNLMSGRPIKAIVLAGAHPTLANSSRKIVSSRDGPFG